MRSFSIATLHVLTILIGYTSWLLLRWELVLVGLVGYFLQLAVYGDCILTRWQYGEPGSGQPRVTFFSRAFERIGVHVSRRTVVIVADYLVPPLVFAAALYHQVILGNSPLLF